MTKITSIILSQVIFLMLTGWQAAAAAAADDIEVRQRGTNATPIEREPPRYPANAAKSSEEGWVLVSFIVDIDGTTKDIEILDTSISNTFERASLRAVKKWTYVPATQNGNAVPQAKTQVKLIFALEGFDGGVSTPFFRLYKKGAKAIKNGDLESADKIIGRLEKRQQRVLAEIGYLDMLKGSYWQAKGNEKKALLYYARSLTTSDDYKDTSTLRSLLTQNFSLSVRQNYLHRAMTLYTSLTELDDTLAAEDPIHDLAHRVKTYLDGSKPFASQGKVRSVCATCEESRPFWGHSLYRKRFTLDKIEGNIEEFKLLCGFHYVTIAFERGMMWNIEDDWGQCEVHVYGDVGTTFKLVEYQRPQTD